MVPPVLIFNATEEDFSFKLKPDSYYFQAAA
jgi:hypothetical protein